MKLDLDLMELNSLYVAVSHQLETAKQDYKDYPSYFFQTQLVTAQNLVDKVQDALYAETKRFDESIAEMNH